MFLFDYPVHPFVGHIHYNCDSCVNLRRVTPSSLFCSRLVFGFAFNLVVSLTCGSPGVNPRTKTRARVLMCVCVVQWSSQELEHNKKEEEKKASLLIRFKKTQTVSDRSVLYNLAS